MKNLRRLTASAFVALSVGLAAPAANAFDPTGNPVADAIFQGFEAATAKVKSVGSVDNNGSDTIIRDIVLVPADAPDNGELKIARIELSGASAGSNGLVTAAALRMGPVEFRSNGASLTIELGEATNITLPSAEQFKSASINAQQFVFERLNIQNVVVTSPQGHTLPISSMRFENGDFVDGRPTSSRGAIEGVVIDPAIFEEPQAKAQLAALGYDAVRLALTFAGRWEPSSGTLELNSFKLDAADMGVLTLGMKLMGWTQQVQDALNKAGDNAMQSLQALQNVQIANLSIRFDNNSLADRILDMVAKQQGSSRKDMVAGLEMMLPLVLSGLQNPEFQKSVSAAVMTFLRDPKNLTAAANPKQPVPVSQLTGSVMMAPQTLPIILGVSVKANQ